MPFEVLKSFAGPTKVLKVESPTKVPEDEVIVNHRTLSPPSRTPKSAGPFVVLESFAGSAEVLEEESIMGK